MHACVLITEFPLTKSAFFTNLVKKNLPYKIPYLVVFVKAFLPNYLTFYLKCAKV